MSWLSFDDGYTEQPVWDGLPHDARWHYHAMAELCCRQRRYDGRLPRALAMRCSDVTDPARSIRELTGAGLLADHGAVLEVTDIDHFLPPEGQRPESLLPRKRASMRAWRLAKCERGEHSKDCPPATCPVKLARNAERAGLRVTGRVAGNAGSGRDGSGGGTPTLTKEKDLARTRDRERVVPLRVADASAVLDGTCRRCGGECRPYGNGGAPLCNDCRSEET